MARTVICMVIMAVLTAASIGAAIYTDTRCDELISIIDEVISSEGEGSQGQITESLDSLEREWDKSYKGFSFIAQREMINDISFELSQLRERYTRGSDDFIAECRGVRDRLIRLREIL
ncbi:MAG: DUF4363 family protein [Ruminococcus sp.]|nr:DUF4363 family protein [Ruminococcus sp.]